MKVAIFLPVWRRPELTKICYRGVKRLVKEGKKHGVEWIPMVGWSEDEHRELAEEAGFLNWFVPNENLGAKNQAHMKMCMEHEWDYIMQMGSDDFFYKGFTEMWKAEAEKHGYFRFNLLDLYDLKTKTRCRTTAMTGLGRTFPRDIIQLMFHKSRRVWMDRPNGCDNHSERQIWKYANRAPFIVKNKLVGVDIKAGTNVTPFGLYRGQVDVVALTELPEWRSLNALRKKMLDVVSES